MLKRTLFVLGAAALTTGTLMLGSALHAAPIQDAITVSYADLDLSSSNDVARLERRVNKAADKLCRVGERGAAQRAYSTECKADVLANAKTDIDTAVSSARTGTVRIALRRSR